MDLKKLRLEKPEKATPEDMCRCLAECLPDILPEITFPGDEEPTEILPLIDYLLASYTYRETMLSELLKDAKYFWAEAVPNAGGSEGVYLDVSLVTQGNGAPDRWHIITAKTLEEGAKGYAVMGILGGYITYLMEQFL